MGISANLRTQTRRYHALAGLGPGKPDINFDRDDWRRSRPGPDVSKLDPRIRYLPAGLACCFPRVRPSPPVVHAPLRVITSASERDDSPPPLKGVLARAAAASSPLPLYVRCVSAPDAFKTAVREVSMSYPFILISLLRFSYNLSEIAAC